MIIIIVVILLGFYDRNQKRGNKTDALCNK